MQNEKLKSKESLRDKSFFLKGGNEAGILLLHGWTSPPDELRPIAKYLNSFGYTVYAPLLRGHGTRPEDLECVCWRDWLEDARRALVELRKKSSIIFIGGISMGADLAMHLAEEKSVAGIVSMGGAIRYKFHTLAKIVLYCMALTKKYRKKYYPPWVRKKMGKRKVYMYYPVESAKEVVRLADTTRKILPEISKPILIIQSTTDHMVSKKSPQIIFNSVQSKVREIFWVENAYHVFADRKEVWERVKEFIEKNSKI